MWDLSVEIDPDPSKECIRGRHPGPETVLLCQLMQVGQFGTCLGLEWGVLRLRQPGQNTPTHTFVLWVQCNCFTSCMCVALTCAAAAVWQGVTSAVTTVADGAVGMTKVSKGVIVHTCVTRPVAFAKNVLLLGTRGGLECRNQQLGAQVDVCVCFCPVFCRRL